MISLVYDGTYDGFLSAVFLAYARKIENSAMLYRESGGVPLGECVMVQTDAAHAERVQNRLCKLGISRHAYKAWLTGEDSIDDAVLALIRKAIADGKSPLGDRSVQCVKRVCEASDRVGLEVHRFQQFVRFMKVSEAPPVYVADIEPAYDILPMLGNHFFARFSSQFFIIRDLRFKKSLIWDRERWYISEDRAVLELKLRDRSEFGKLWKGYFDAVAIPWRRNKKLQAQFVPQRFRPHLTEFN